MTVIAPAFTEVSQSLLLSMQQTDYAGHDPFDGLNSALFEHSGLGRSEFARLAWLQLYKRSPVNFRPLTGTAKARNPKGVALVILGLLESYHTCRDNVLLAEAVRLADWLLENPSPKTTWDHACWGYHFDWQARAFYVPKGKPNMITSCYVARALWALSEANGEPRYAEVARDASRFIFKHLYNTEQQFFAYIPGETTFVHNANLWGAAMVARGGVELGDQAMLDAAKAACDLSLTHQATDGSWAYGTRSHHGFIDGFHTGYNLEALSMAQQYLEPGCFQAAIDRGLAYYRAHFFEPDGLPKYYHDSPWPIDMHSTAQAVITLIKLGNDDDQALVERVLNWSIAHMYDAKRGAFYYQKHRFFTNKIPYMRWTQAWMYYALAFFNSHQPPSSISTRSGS
ncbi:MAG: hypothetical protein ACJAWL_002379 [Motiliproteus sp.]|jgi:hypothetical protein